MGLKDVYYKLTDSNYSKRSKDAAKMLEVYTKKNSDYFITQDKVAIILYKGIKYISQISNTPTQDITYETNEVNRILGSSITVDKAKKTITKNKVLSGTSAVSLLASAFFLPLAIKTIPTTFLP